MERRECDSEGEREQMQGGSVAVRVGRIKGRECRMQGSKQGSLFAPSHPTLPFEWPEWECEGSNTRRECGGECKGANGGNVRMGGSNTGRECEGG